VSTAVSSEPAARTLEQFVTEYSRYVDGFLARRSVLHSTLFPEKPAQMDFGYRVMGTIYEDLIPWLRPRLDGPSYGEVARRIRSPILAVGVTGSSWVYLFSLLRRTFEGEPWSPKTARDVLSYWREGFETYLANANPAGGAFPPPGGRQWDMRLLDAECVAALVEHLDERAAPAAPPFIAAATNYSWLTEAESRQGVGAHGLYDVDGGKLLVREFANLSADRYPWIDQDVAELPHGPISVVLRLKDVEADFDGFGVVRMDPEDYVDHLTGVAVLTADGFVDDPGTWLAEMRRNVGRAHRAAFRTIAAWDRRQRFIAGALSYTVMWIPIIELAGGTDADVRRLLLDPFHAAVDALLDEHLARTDEPRIWTWASRADRPTVFAPVIEGLS
jgi:hypothetical protein